MQDNPQKTPRESAQHVADELKITIDSVFVPFSQSRNKDEKWLHTTTGKPTNRPRYSLNWRVTIKVDGRAILTTDYSADMAHCPAYKDYNRTKLTNDYDRIIWECEHGKSSVLLHSVHQIIGRNQIVPDNLNVLYSIVQDASAINFNDFADWADTFGYDNDSRRAEKIYNTCVEYGLKLRNTIGDANLTRLAESFQDY